MRLLRIPFLVSLLTCLPLVVAQPSASAQDKTATSDGEAASEEHGDAAKASTSAAGDQAKNGDETGAKEDSHATDSQGGDAHGEADDGGGHEGGHHDSSDLSHNNAAPKLEDPSDFKSDLAIWTLIVFFCLLALLSKFAWGPIMQGLDRREQSIAAMIDEAKQSAVKAAEQIKVYEAKLAAAGDEAQKIVAQARKDAEATGERLKTEAAESAQRERHRAIADISNAKNAALQEMTERSVDLAVAIAGRLVRDQITADDRARLIREAMDQLPSQN